MITNNEINELTLSTTKKDFYQIWNELMEVADKLSSSWSPASTNESDPGIVLLKVLTAIADKLNYNVDVKALEAYMPSVTERESMQKLTDMLGYTMHYYRAATTEATISYKTSNDVKINAFQNGIFIPKFTNLKSSEDDINYITLEDITLSSNEPSRKVSVMEGEIIECESAEDGIITTMHFDDSNRYILPETNAAENGVFIFDVTDGVESIEWTRVDNLNTVLPKTKVYKFGYDSKLKAPYVQFPDDVSQLIGDGLRIRYVRTNGSGGNIAANILTKLEIPALWSTIDDSDEANANIKALDAEAFTVTNTAAARNGMLPEGIDEAYNNYKKVIGTFDTLVTCRDYMNKIYQLTESQTNTTPLVSNIIVSDIRDDINRAVTICSFNEYGICYKEVARADNTVERSITHFDLMLYPFKTVYGLNTKQEYENSFKLDGSNNAKIRQDISALKTISHEFKDPLDTEIACIKNYLRLNARVTTKKKVTYTEEISIITNICSAIFENFNARQVDFGEEIPEQIIHDVIVSADTRIKDISMDEPDLYTNILYGDGTEETIRVEDSVSELNSEDIAYNKLVLRDVLAGRVAAFEYDEAFKPDYRYTRYPSSNIQPQYPASTGSYASTDVINKMTSEFRINASDAALSKYGETTTIQNDGTDKTVFLKDNEIIQFRLPNFKTTKTYGAYVNYYIKLNNNNTGTEPVAASFITLNEFLSRANNWQNIANYATNMGRVDAFTKIITADAQAFTSQRSVYGALFTISGNADIKTATAATTFDIDAEYYALPLTDSTASVFIGWLSTYRSDEPTMAAYNQITSTSNDKLALYRATSQDFDRPVGNLVDSEHKKYLKASSITSKERTSINNYYVQNAYIDSNSTLVDGLGVNGKYNNIGINSEYELKDGEYLLVNYTESETGSDGTTTNKTTRNIAFEAGTVIRPNFALIDSDNYRTSHSYSKKDGFTFIDYPNCPGMFTMGANEQIEIREIVQVHLDGMSYIYWIRKDDVNTQDNHYTEFIFNENYDGGTNNAYTLKEGEYLFYTTANKSSLAYYGAGSLIVKHNQTPRLLKDNTKGTVNEDTIMEYGIEAGIPWTLCNLGTNQNDGDRIRAGSAALTVIEHQYITLADGDRLKAISSSAISGNDCTSIDMDLNNDWQTVSFASYRPAGATVDSSLPEISCSNLQWKVRSRLDFNMGKEIDQTLHFGDSITIYSVSIGGQPRAPFTLEPITDSTGKLIPLTINSTYDIQWGADNIDIHLTDLQKQTKGQFKLSTAKKADPEINEEGIGLVLDNYTNEGAYYTKVDFDDGEISSFSLNTSIPTNDFGLIMIHAHYMTESVSDSDKVHVVGTGISEFNSGNTSTNNIVLTEGMHVIKIPTSATQLSVTGHAGSIVFSGLSLVKGINPKLKYKHLSSGSETALDKLLHDIKSVIGNTPFYYNMPISSKTAIELNPYVSTDTMANPQTFYDKNSTNNKFVISEIDAEYLATGITLTKASKGY